MKCLVFGQNGQLARELVRRSGDDVTLHVLGSDKADFSNPDDCVAFVEATDADVVINAAAFTAVDQAETDEERAILINATTPGRLSVAAAKRGLPFVQVSTDYVFDGSGSEPFQTDHPTNPIGAYGRSKLLGEQGVRDADGAHAILRTSWVVSAHGNNFVKTMLRLGRERDRLTIVADQIGGPTPAAALADACLAAAKGLRADPAKSGTYHVSGGPDVSWADFARAIFRLTGIQCEVADIPSSDYPTPAARPLNSRMDNSTFEKAFGVARPDWETGLREILTDLGEI